MRIHRIVGLIVVGIALLVLGADADATAPATPVHVSFASGGSAGGIPFADEDVLTLDETGQWSVLFDGSDVGLRWHDVDAVAVLDDGDGATLDPLILSIDRWAWLPGVGHVGPSDLLRFTPTSLGETTAGAYSIELDGWQAGLTTPGENVDAVFVDPEGRLVVSTRGRVRVPAAAGGTLAGRGHDLIARTGTGWELVVDGSDIGLTAGRENVWGASMSAPDTIELTTRGGYQVPGLTGDRDDVLELAITSTGPDTAGQFSLLVDLGSTGIGWARPDAISVVAAGPAVPGCTVLGSFVATELSQQECDGLVALHQSTDGPNWTDDTGWLTATDPCTWFGVICGGNGVQTLALGVNGLGGQLPAEIGQFPVLTQLNLSDNDIGGPIPASIGDLDAVLFLLLHRNELTGSIPPEIGDLDAVDVLQLDNNQLTGSIPPEIGGLQTVRTVILGNNQLTGSLPPEIGQMSSLEDFRFRSNQISGPIPPEIGQLTNLTRLWWQFNALSGPIPPEIGQLTNLRELWLDGNQLSGPLPAEIGDLASIELLWLSGNPITGALPPEVGQLSTMTSFIAVDTLITGPLPTTIADLDALLTLSMVRSQLTGPLPPEIGGMASLQILSLNQSQLSGVVPPELADLTTLTTLALFGQSGCLTADPTTTAFIVGFDPNWDDGCP